MFGFIFEFSIFYLRDKLKIKIMKNIEHTIFLYSKFSNHCKRLLTVIRSSANEEITTVINVKEVCIDSGVIRGRLKSDTTYGIKSVPCFIVVYEDGLTEKYEGRDASNWYVSLMENYEHAKTIQANEVVNQQSELNRLREEAEQSANRELQRGTQSNTNVEQLPNIQPLSEQLDDRQEVKLGNSKADQMKAKVREMEEERAREMESMRPNGMPISQ
jgi:hypothetical protein